MDEVQDGTNVKPGPTGDADADRDSTGAPVRSDRGKDSSESETHAGRKNTRDNKKKDDRSADQVLKALSALGTSEEKLAAMCKKYADLVDENRKLQVQVKQGEKRVVAVQREKEQLQTEHNKAILTRSRLESLCRELQKQNKQIKDESLQRVKEEEEKRKSVSNKFQSTLGEITHLMQQNNENNSKLRDENLEMQNKFKTLCEQYELREQQVEKLSKQMQLESQLAEAKLIKLKIEMVAEKEVIENEKKQLLIELAAYQNRCKELQTTEETLNSQIAMYNEKFDKFQVALAKNNELYNGFRGEIKNMSKKIVKLEKETSVWKTRWENNHKALLQMGSEKQQLQKQLSQLQKLCRTLQGDRTSLLMQLKEEGLTPKLSGERNSAEPETQDKPETEALPPLTDSKIVQNGNENAETENGLMKPDDIVDFEKEAVEPDVSVGGDVSENDAKKSNSNTKSKKTKENSKRKK